MSEIEWTEKTWNAIVGCSKMSPGCDYCYAMGDSPHRFASKYEREGVVVLRGKATRPGLTYVPRKPSVIGKGPGKSLGKGAQWTGEVRLLPWQLDAPLRRKKPTTWFVNSLADMFHESIVGCEEGCRFIAAMFGVMAATPQHTFQILTKRPSMAREWFAWLDSDHPDSNGRVRSWYPFGVECARYGIGTNEPLRRAVASHPRHSNRERDLYWPLPNVWIGTSVEDQARADERIPELLRIPAAVRFLSCEPLLGPLDLSLWCSDLAGPQPRWTIAGGESGPKSRPCEVRWIRSIVEQCKAAQVPVFVKQDSGKRPGQQGRIPEELWLKEMPSG